jgi:hypothetical protein
LTQMPCRDCVAALVKILHFIYTLASYLLKAQY